MTRVDRLGRDEHAREGDDDDEAGAWLHELAARIDGACSAGAVQRLVLVGQAVQLERLSALLSPQARAHIAFTQARDLSEVPSERLRQYAPLSV